MVTGAMGSTGFQRHFNGFLITGTGLFWCRHFSHLLYPQLGTEVSLERLRLRVSLPTGRLTSFAPQVAPVAAALMVPVCQTCPADAVFSFQLPPAPCAQVVPVSCPVSLFLLVDQSLYTIVGQVLCVTFCSWRGWFCG